MLATPLQIALVARLTTGRAVVPRPVRETGVMRSVGDPAAADSAGLGIDPRDRNRS